MDRIIRVLPEAAKLCPHLKTNHGYDNVFEYVEPGLYALDTTEDGLCLLAYVADHRIRCSLHTVGTNLGLPLAKVKPEACLLWPLSLSEGDEVLSLAGDCAFVPMHHTQAETIGPSFSIVRGCDRARLW